MNSSNNNWSTASLVTLMHIRGIGTRTALKIICNPLIDPPEPAMVYDVIIKASESERRIRVPTQDEFDAAISNASRIIDCCDNMNIRIIGYGSHHYPNILATIPNPPAVLYARGDEHILSNELAVAVIGTRSPSEYGYKCGRAMAKIICEQGGIVVSGLAIGCDTAGHLGAIDANGKTIAVMAHGLDSVSPRQNTQLAQQIIEYGGCLISEYPPGVTARPNYFVERDRIQSGVSRAVVVIETDVEGGTMHTVRFSQAQNRILGAFLHPPDKCSHEKARGNRMLINQKQAMPISGKDDLINMINSIRSSCYAEQSDSLSQTHEPTHAEPRETQLDWIEKYGCSNTRS